MVNRETTLTLLAGWGGWARTGHVPHVQTRAGSAEGNHIADAGDVFADDTRPRRVVRLEFRPRLETCIRADPLACWVNLGVERS